MRVRNLLQSYIGKSIILTPTELFRISREWETFSLDGEPLSGAGLIEFEEHPVNDDRYKEPYWISVSNIYFEIHKGRLTLAEPGIELYPDPGRWKLDPESAWNEADIESAKGFLDSLTAKKE